MPDEHPKHAFVSYVKEDSQRVDLLCRMLEAANIPYWRDRKDLDAGDDWKRAIRDAIRSGSIAFIACFSEATNAREVSYMNEELTLAVEEFRKRPPGVTWLLPVRFDDVRLPDWDLGGGRTINDINYADLFGDEFSVGAMKLVTAVARVLGTSTVDATTRRAAVEEAASTDRPALLRRLTKEMVPDPARRIELDDLVTAEARRIALLINDETAFPLVLPGTSEAEHVRYLAQRATNLWNVTAPLAHSVQVASRWASEESLASYVTALRSISVAGLALRGGNTALSAMRTIPALGLVFSAGIASITQGRFDTVRRLLVDQQVPDRYEGQQPLLLSIHPWSPFNDERVAEAVARSEVEGADAWESLNQPRGRYRTPASQWLEHLLRPVFEDQFVSDEEFVQAFERTEIMLGVLAQDLSSRRYAEHKLASDVHWYGRATWSMQYSRVNPVDALKSDLASQRDAWPPLRAGLFGGAVDRADAALTIYGDNFRAIAQRRW